MHNHYIGQSATDQLLSLEKEQVIVHRVENSRVAFKINLEYSVEEFDALHQKQNFISKIVTNLFQPLFPTIEI